MNVTQNSRLLLLRSPIGDVLCEVQIDYNTDFVFFRGAILRLVLVPHLRLGLQSCLSPSHIASKVCKVLPCSPIQNRLTPAFNN